MNRKIVISAKTLIVLFMAMLFICSSVAMAAPKGDPINIGMITNLSAPYGTTAKISMEIAVKEINDAGGILGRPIHLIVEDWKRQVPMAVAAYRKLVMKEKCTVVFTEGTEAVVALMEEGSKMFASYPHIQIGNYVAADSVTDVVCSNYEKYKFFFRPFPRTNDAFDESMKTWTVFNTIGTKKLAVVVEDCAFTRTLITGKPGAYPPFKEFMEKKGFNVVLVTQTASNEKMFLPTFELVAKSGADTMFWATAYTNHATVAKQWAESAAKDIDLISWSGSSAYKNFMAMTDGAGLGWISQYPELDVPYTRRAFPS
jgi:ABC-type branched-subunit amino acid transport system substrate-binding protein